MNCCAPWNRREGQKPVILAVMKLGRTWGCIVGSALLDGYRTRGSLLRAARKERDAQRVYPCGHVERSAHPVAAREGD